MWQTLVESAIGAIPFLLQITLSVVDFGGQCQLIVLLLLGNHIAKVLARVCATIAWGDKSRTQNCREEQ